jgi:hypothetical protein
VRETKRRERHNEKKGWGREVEAQREKETEKEKRKEINRKS